MGSPQARDDDGKWGRRELSDPEIEALARQADEQGYVAYPEPIDDRDDVAFDRAMLAEDRRADREEASWARWERRNL